MRGESLSTSTRLAECEYKYEYKAMSTSIRVQKTVLEYEYELEYYKSGIVTSSHSPFSVPNTPRIDTWRVLRFDPTHHDQCLKKLMLQKQNPK